MSRARSATAANKIRASVPRAIPTTALSATDTPGEMRVSTAPIEANARTEKPDRIRSTITVAITRAMGIP